MSDDTGAVAGTAVTAEIADPLGLRVISGDPTAQELAAVTAVISGVVEEIADARELAAPVAGSQWTSRSAALRQPLAAGRGAWNSFHG